MRWPTFQPSSPVRRVRLMQRLEVPFVGEGSKMYLSLLGQDSLVVPSVG